MLQNSHTADHTTTLAIYKDKHEKARQALRELEGKLLVCFVCLDEGEAKPRSMVLFKCCGGHYVCGVHHTKKHLVTKHVESRGGHTALKCAHSACKADALWPPVRLEKAACDQNAQTFETLKVVQEASEATIELEKACDRERAISLNRTEALVATARAEASAAEARRQAMVSEVAKAKTEAAEAKLAAEAAEAAVAAVKAKKKPNKAQFIAANGVEAWAAKGQATKRRAADRKYRAKVNLYNSRLAAILPPYCIGLAGRDAYDEYCARNIDPAPVDAAAAARGGGGSSSAGGAWDDECLDAEDEEATDSDEEM